MSNFKHFFRYSYIYYVSYIKLIYQIHLQILGLETLEITHNEYLNVMYIYSITSEAKKRARNKKITNKYVNANR